MGNLSNNLLLPVQEIRHSLYNNKAFKCPSNEERLLHHTKFNLNQQIRLRNVSTKDHHSYQWHKNDKNTVLNKKYKNFKNKDIKNFIHAG